MISRRYRGRSSWRTSGGRSATVFGTFIDEACPRRELTFAQWLDLVINEAEGDAAALRCRDEVLHCRTIAAYGTSADAQLAVYRQARENGAEREEALASVTTWLAETTVERCKPLSPHSR